MKRVISFWLDEEGTQGETSEETKNNISDALDAFDYSTIKDLKVEDIEENAN